MRWHPRPAGRRARRLDFGRVCHDPAIVTRERPAAPAVCIDSKTRGPSLHGLSAVDSLVTLTAMCVPNHFK